MNKRERDMRSLFDQEVEVIDVVMGRGTHCKVQCRHNGYRFNYTTSIAGETNEKGRAKKLRADLRRIKRAIDNGHDVVLDKYKVWEEKT